MVSVLVRSKPFLKLSFLIFFLIFFASNRLTVSAVTVENPTEMILEEADVAREEIQSSLQGNFDFRQTLENLGSLFFGELKNMLSRVPVLIVIIILSGIKNTMEFPLSLNKPIALGCFSASALITGEIFSDLQKVSEDMIGHLSEFVYLTIPALTGLIANGGRVLSAAKSTYLILGFMNLIVFLIQRFFFPLILLYFVFTVTSSLVEKNYFAAIKNAVKSLIKIILPLLVGIFMTLLTIFTSVSKSADELTLKTAKMALGNCIPFLGNVLTDSGEYLIQTITQIKAQAGLAGVLTVLYLLITPIAKITAGILIFKGLSIIACFLTDTKMTSFYEDISAALSMIAGVMGTVAVIAMLGMMILMGS